MDVKQFLDDLMAQLDGALQKIPSKLIAVTLNTLPTGQYQEDLILFHPKLQI